MNEQQIKFINTSDLVAIREMINEELRDRRRNVGLSKRFEFIDRLSPIEFNSKKEIEEYNSSGLFSIPGHHRKLPGNICIYLPALIKQDWSHLYSGGSEEKIFYVYCHVDPTKRVFTVNESSGGNYGGEPFYVGKGTGNRAFDLKRNQGHGKKLAEVLAKGVPPERITKIVFSGLNEAKAFELEAKLIYFFGTIYSRDIKKKGLLYNLDVPKYPEFTGQMIEYPSKEFFKQKRENSHEMERHQQL